MKVKINYQGILVEKTGIESESISEAGSSLLVLETIRGMHPSLRDMNFVVAINGVISHGDIEIKGGDSIALIPPAPGG